MSGLTNLLFNTWILLAVAILLLIFYVRRKWSFLRRWNIPHDPPSILNLGNMRVVLSDRYYTYGLECKKKFGPVWGYYTATSPRIVIHDPEILEQVMVKEFSCFANRFSTNPQLGGTEMRNGLPWIGEEKWKRIRTTLTPTFSTGKLRQMAGIVNWCANNTFKALDRRIENADGVFVPKDVFNKLALDVICSTAYSQNVNSQDETKEAPTIYYQAKAFFKTGVLNFAALLVIALPFLSPLFLWYGDRQDHIKYFRSLCIKLIKDREQNPHASSRVDLMQLMIESKIDKSDLKPDTRKGLLQEELIGNAMTMLLAGFETTGNSLSYFAYNMAMHPEIQKQLQAEIDGIFENGETLDLDSASSLEYLDMCVNESLRLYCPATRTIRTAKHEVTVSGLTIPKGIMVCIPVYAMCHDPEYWDEPMKFNPERMHNVADINPFVFQPFGSGPRKCIGARYAHMVIKLTFCKLLHHFTFEPTEDTPKPPLRLGFDLASYPKVNYALRVVRRN